MSYDPDAIANLFSEDVAYRYHPNGEPIVGRDGVVQSWLGTRRRGRFDPRCTRHVRGRLHASVAVDGDVVVATGTSRYRDEPGGPVTRIYDNCFVMRFDRDGRCLDFTEYYHRRP